MSFRPRNCPVSEFLKIPPLICLCPVLLLSGIITFVTFDLRVGIVFFSRFLYLRLLLLRMADTNNCSKPCLQRACVRVAFAGGTSSGSRPNSDPSYCFGEHQLPEEVCYDYCIGSMPQQQQQQHRGCSTEVSSSDVRIAMKSTSSMMSLTKKRGIFPKPATNIMRAWLFHHLTVSFGLNNVNR